MILSTQFEGDSKRVADAQHDVYYEALDIIVKNCNRLALFAKRVLQSEKYEDWGLINQYDHRTLQFQHDLLATTWRYRSNAAQRIVDLTGSELNISQEWLEWLANEVQGWIDRPEFVRLVQVILTNQNDPLGYEAETRLNLEIMDYFYDIPWDSELRVAFKNEIQKINTSSTVIPKS
jgi:hypothetical protein